MFAAQMLAEEDDVGPTGQDDDPSVDALYSERSAREDDGDLEDAGDFFNVDTGVADALPLPPGDPGGPAGAGAAQMPGLMPVGGGMAVAGGPGAAPQPAGPPPAPAPGPAPGPGPAQVQVPVPADVDPYDGWHNGREDTAKGRAPHTCRPENRFRTQNIPADMPAETGKDTGLAFLRLLWDDDICDLAIKWTNARLAALPKQSACTMPITKKELWLWQAVTAVMGICKLPTIESYWSKTHYGQCEVICSRVGPAPCGVCARLRASIHPDTPSPPPTCLELTVFAPFTLRPATSFFDFTDLGMSRSRYFTIKSCLSFCADREVTPEEKAAPEFDRYVTVWGAITDCVTVPRTDARGCPGLLAGCGVSGRYWTGSTTTSHATGSLLRS